MPKIFYTQDEFESLKDEKEKLEAQVKDLVAMRPQWAQGYSTDSIAAQSKAIALQQVWDALKVSSQTMCMAQIKHLQLHFEKYEPTP